MRLLGLDVGEIRIGVAVSDLLGKTAQPTTVIVRKNIQADTEELHKIIRQYHIEKVIVGLPLNLDGSLGVQGEAVKAFAGEVEGKIDIPLEFYDERLTTRAARKVLLEGDISRARRKEVVDKLAAALILQSYLDRKNVHGR
jgi:putative Holliday junction resolvase